MKGTKVSIFPDDALHKADQFCFAAVDGGIIFVLGHQPNLTVAAAQALDGGFITDPGYYDLTVIGKRWEPRGFSRVAAAFSSYDGDLSLPLGKGYANDASRWYQTTT